MANYASSNRLRQQLEAELGLEPRSADDDEVKRELRPGAATDDLVRPHRLIGDAMQRAHLPQEAPPWPEWGFPESDLHQWEGSFGAEIAWFRSFAFLPGMLFGSQHAWWSSEARLHPNEGLAFGLYVDPSGDLHPIPPETQVPSVCTGVVVACFPSDLTPPSRVQTTSRFSAKTLVVCHPQIVREGRMLHSVYGHIKPSVRVGAQVAASSSVGEIAAAQNSAPGGGLSAPAHLQLCLAQPTILIRNVKYFDLRFGHSFDQKHKVF